MPSARERRTDRERWSWVLTSERALASGHRCPLPRDHLGYDAESQTNRSPPGPGAHPVRSSSEGIDAPGAGTGPHPGASASDVEPHLVPRRRASMPPSKGPRDTRHPSPPGLSSSRSCEEGIDALLRRSASLSKWPQVGKRVAPAGPQRRPSLREGHRCPLRRDRYPHPLPAAGHRDNPLFNRAMSASVAGVGGGVPPSTSTRQTPSVSRTQMD